MQFYTNLNFSFFTTFSYICTLIMDIHVEITSAIDWNVKLPVSKSISARTLIINALTHNDIPSINMMQCDDSKMMATALQSHTTHINVEGAGTAMRFLTAYFACQDGRTVTLDGNERMRQRPIGPLVDALRQMGANIKYLGIEGFPPLKIDGRKLHGRNLTMRGDVSSQFISALLMIAPVIGGFTLTLKGNIVSRPYIDMTLALMCHYGVKAVESMTEHEHQIMVPKGQYTTAPITIEGDWSAASYWFALKTLLPESKISLSPLSENSLQGDRAIADMMEPLGVTIDFSDNNHVILSSKSIKFPQHYERDMSNTPDLVPTLAVTLCLLRVPFTLTGVATLRIKESDRLEAMRIELAKLGYTIEIGTNSLNYNGNHATPVGEVIIDPHNDHRIAMALSLASTRHKIVIKNAEVVTKSYPNWWQQLINA